MQIKTLNCWVTSCDEKKIDKMRYIEGRDGIELDLDFALSK
jgi:hypothetical protein